MSGEERYEVLSKIFKMAWAFQARLAIKLSNLDNRAAFQAEIYKNIKPDTAKAIIAETCRPNHAMHNISALLNCLPIHFLRWNEIDKDIMTFRDTYVGCKSLFYFPVPVLRTHHID